jgi:hypothetical protein
VAGSLNTCLQINTGGDSYSLNRPYSFIGFLSLPPDVDQFCLLGLVYTLGLGRETEIVSRNFVLFKLCILIRQWILSSWRGVIILSHVLCCIIFN